MAVLPLLQRMKAKCREADVLPGETVFNCQSCKTQSLSGPPTRLSVSDHLRRDAPTGLYNPAFGHPTPGGLRPSTSPPGCRAGSGRRSEPHPRLQPRKVWGAVPALPPLTETLGCPPHLNPSFHQLIDFLLLFLFHFYNLFSIDFSLSFWASLHRCLGY